MLAAVGGQGGAGVGGGEPGRADDGIHAHAGAVGGADAVGAEDGGLAALAGGVLHAGDEDPRRQACGRSAGAGFVGEGTVLKDDGAVALEDDLAGVDVFLQERPTLERDDEGLRVHLPVIQASAVGGVVAHP